MEVPLLDLKAQFARIKDEITAAIHSVLESQRFILGPEVSEFEKAIAEYSNCAAAVGVSSGTDALLASLMTLGIGQGDEVITTPYTFFATAGSIWRVGAKPVFVDIEPDTYNLDPARIREAISPRCRAMIPVHFAGQIADMDAIMAVAKKHNLIVVEDACQAHGSEFKGKRAGSFGTGTFSFYPTKNMTSAEGGMITTNDDAVNEKCRVLRNHGMRRRYYHDELGYNFRMTDVHAAIGNAQLKKLAFYNQKRQENAEFYNANLKGVTIPFVPDGYTHVYHQYTIRVPNGRRDALREYLKENDIGSEIYYPLPIHQQGFYKELLGEKTYPQAESAAAEVLSIPVHPSLTRADLEKVASAINEFMAKG